MGARRNTPWQNRIVGHGVVPIEKLVPNPANWRAHPPAQMDALAQVLESVGLVQEIIVNVRTGRVVDGHGRLKLARERGEDSLPTVYVDLSEEEERLVLATLDPITGLAVADTAALDSLLQQVDAGEGALAELIESVAADAGLPIGGTVTGLVDPDEAPDQPAPADIFVQSGNVYALGDHRLMCADATAATSAQTLLDGAAADLLLTDPPYAVSYDADARPGNRRRRFEALENDDLGPEQYQAFLGSFFDAIDLPPGVPAYLFHGDIMGEQVRRAFREAGFHLASPIVWTKTAPVMGRGDYHWQHEVIAYGWRTGAPHRWYGGRKQSTVWQFPTDHVAGGPDHRYAHPTQKPVALLERALMNSSRPGDIVLDPFLGSGSTLIAAERLGRRCHGMEIEPRYVQVAVERWERFTGRKAEVIRGQA